MEHQAAIDLAESLVSTLPAGAPGLFNPWRDRCPLDEPWNTPVAKQARLAHHLARPARFILCGEAPGYQGCRHSGVAFTSERLLLEGSIPGISVETRRLTSRALPFSEPSATIVWRTLYELGIAEETILWNALQLHPHRPGETHSNRTPTNAELALGAPALRMLAQAFPKATIVAIGQKAALLMRDMGVVPAACVRHPANGGATLFANGMRDLISVGVAA